MWSSEDLPCYLNLIQPRHLHTLGRPRIRNEGIRQALGYHLPPVNSNTSP